MSYDLRPEEIRVLGVLIEKSLALPDYYPMTINSIVAACNQKNNRDPVTEFSESDVSTAVSSLRRRQLADQSPPERNSRAVRFQHLVDQRFGWNAAQRAILCELMIRGPQTVGELRTHASRMTHLESVEYTRELLGELERADPPLVVELEREPGRRERRFAQLLGGMPVLRVVQYGPADEANAEDISASRSSSRERALVDPLEARLSALEARVAELSRRVEQLGGVTD